MNLKPLYTSYTGVRHFWRDNGDGTQSVISYQPEEQISAILDYNKALANENSGWSTGGGKMMRRMAHIPAIIQYKWLVEEGWNCMNPDHADRLDRKLNDPDYAYLRTAHWRI